MSNNDEKISSLIKKIDLKKNNLGKKPRATYRGNGIVNDNNLNVITLDNAVKLLGYLLIEKESLRLAAREIGDELPMGFLLDDINDVKIAIKRLIWERESKNLKKYETQLKNLLSDDAKTKSILDDIESAI